LEEWFGEIEWVMRTALEGEGTPLERIRSLAETYVDMVMAHPDRTKILLRQSLGDAPASHWPQEPQRLLRIVSDFIAEGQEAKMIAPVDPHALVLSVVAMVAFFSSSAPVLAPQWFGNPATAESIDRVKRHVIELMDRCLTVENQPLTAPSKSAAG
jgi:AcrR family transcriptional regulator